LFVDTFPAKKNEEEEEEGGGESIQKNLASMPRESPRKSNRLADPPAHEPAKLKAALTPWPIPSLEVRFLKRHGQELAGEELGGIGLDGVPGDGRWGLRPQSGMENWLVWGVWTAFKLTGPLFGT
jgi:hypothetical protein